MSVAHEFDFASEQAWDEVWASVTTGAHPRLRRNAPIVRQSLGHRALDAEVLTAEFVLPKSDDAGKYIEDERIENGIADALSVPRGTLIIVPGKVNTRIAVRIARARKGQVTAQ